jgi:phage terminase large subunit GpA-like protein
MRDGDLASLYLDRTRKAQWRGMTFQMVERMPERMDLWDKYREIRNNEDPVAATIFYKMNRSEMQKGAVVAWEDNYDKNQELDALQHAMNIYCDGYEVFMSEYQNQPVKPGAGTVIVDAETIRSRLNGLDRFTVPMDAPTLTGFIDVHDDLLYYTVVAWSDDCTGYVIDYGTYPEQSRRIFRKSDKDLIVMKKGHETLQTKAIIQNGIETLLKDMLSADYIMENDEKGYESVRFSKILVDSGYVPEVVERAIRMVGSPIVFPSKGIGVQATNEPMRQWNRRKGRRFGHYWIEERPQGRTFLTVTIDTNYWKCRLHETFSVGSGSHGGLTFWGRELNAHQMISEHCTSEVTKFVEHGANKLYEWQITPGRDNHFFDCLVGSLAAASVCGIKLQNEEDDEQKAVLK